MERRELVRNLMLMAAADGQMTQRELELLADRCDLWGIDQEDFREIVADALSNPGELAIPSKRSDREELLSELLHMMAADGKLSQAEKHLFAIFAVAMDLSQEDIQRIIDRAVEQPCDEP